jgi:hypothetical protein
LIKGIMGNDDDLCGTFEGPSYSGATETITCSNQRTGR